MKHREYIVPIGDEAEDYDEIFIGVLRKHKELIRCKDCKYHRGENACEKDGCYGWYDTDYCSRAERREE